MPAIRTKEIERPLCGCGKPVMRKDYTLKGFPVWASSCSNCRYVARLNRKDKCEKCGTTKNLNIDHKDGNRSNNNPDNLETLCWPCHKDKTTKNGEWFNQR
jgi:5-methylcytosine-specific restriction endonuclease McrA